MATISALWDRTVATDTLQDNFHALQQMHQASESRGDRLQIQVDTLLRSAAPYVSFVQDKYETLRGQHAQTVQALGECKQALAERLDQESAIRRLRESLRTIQATRDADRVRFQLEITDKINKLRSQHQAEMGIFQTNHEQMQRNLEDKLEQAEAICTRLRSQLEASEADRLSLRAQCSELSQECVSFESQIGPLRAKVDQAQADLAEALASITDLIPQADRNLGLKLS